MIRLLTDALRGWQHDAGIHAVAIRGMGKAGEGFAPFGAFCAGGDIRFFHQAALAGDEALGDFFTEEYALNHLIHTYGKPYIAFMDGIVMGGGMGLSQGASLRVVTERTKMAMPETRIGLFPDVGGGWFLSRTPGHVGEWLALTGHVLKGDEAVPARLADGCVASAELPALWQHLADTAWDSGAAVQRWVAAHFAAGGADQIGDRAHIDHYFSLPSMAAIIAALEAASAEWARQKAEELRTRSPLMLHVTLEQIRRARHMALADELRMERDLVYHCFHQRAGADSETVEGIDPETRQLRHLEGEIDLEELLVVLALRVAHDVVHHGMHRLVIERLDVDAPHVAVHADHGRQTGRQMQIGCVVLDAESEKLGNVQAMSPPSKLVRDGA